MGVAVDGANRNDFKMVRETIKSIPIKRPRPRARKRQGMCMDKGYDYKEVRKLLKRFGFTAHVRSRGQETRDLKKKAGQRARRWVVERTHSWMNRFRAILIRWSKRADTYLALLHFACGIIAWRAAGLLG